MEKRNAEGKVNEGINTQLISGSFPSNFATMVVATAHK